jgi:hypothetical protein
MKRHKVRDKLIHQPLPERTFTDLEVMAPEWSHALALVCQSPLWRGLEGIDRKEAFVDEASSYASYDDLPPRLQAIYQAAARQLHGQRG